MGIGNAFVSVVLKSPLHPLLSGSTGLVRYVARTSQRTVVTPTQYVKSGDELIIFVAHHESKNWWRNFRTDHALDVLVQGQWLPMIGRVVAGSTHPEQVAPLIEMYLKEFPKAKRFMVGGTGEERARNAVFVWCQPRLARVEPAHFSHLRHPHLPHAHLPHLDIKPIDLDPA